MSTSTRLSLATDGYRGGGGAGADFCVFSPPEIVGVVADSVVVVQAGGVITLVATPAIAVAANDVTAVDPNDPIVVQVC